MNDDTRDGLAIAAENIGGPIVDELTKDISAIVSEALNAAFENPTDSDGFYPQVVKPYVTAFVYEALGTELRNRAKMNADLVEAAVARRYGG